MTLPEDKHCPAVEVTVDIAGCVKLKATSLEEVHLSPWQMRELVAWWERREQGEETT
jgi:hypothetical protein